MENSHICCMAFENDAFRTGRTTTFFINLFLVVVLAWLGIARFAGVGGGTTLNVVSALILVFASSALESEIFTEGARRGLKQRDYTLFDIAGAIFGAGTFVIGVTGFVSSMFAVNTVPIGGVTQGFVLIVTAFLLGRELVTA